MKKGEDRLDFVTMGETMVAFAPDEPGRLRYASSFRPRIAGAESNTAIGMRRLGHSAGWISRIGTDEFGQMILRALRADGVDTSLVEADPQAPTGLMFKETAAGGETRVTYYRAWSAASRMDAAFVPEEVFRDAGVLHLTGITPVLSDSCREAVLRAMELAEQYQVPVSFDPNLRFKLWKGRDYTGLMRTLAARAKILLIGKDEAEHLYGTGEIEPLREQVCSAGKTEYLVVKDGANGAVAASRSECVPIPPFPCRSVDPVGAGDAFNAGFLAGLLEGKTLAECGQYGAVMGAMATQTTGDVEGYPDREELLAALSRQKTVYR